MEHVCKNCGKEFSGHYCYNCGQKFNVPRFSFKHIFEEAFHAVTHTDKSFLTYAYKLITKPGLLAYEYIVERKRKKYYNPFTFFLLIIAINVFTRGSELDLKDELFNQNNEYGHIFNLYSKVLTLIIIPIVAFVVWLIHARKKKLYYSEYTVFTMILMSLLSIIDIIVSGVNYLLSLWMKKDISIEDNFIFLVLAIAYLAYADFQFHKPLRNATVFKSTLTGIAIFIVQIIVYVFIIFAFIRHFEGIGNLYFYGIRLKL